MNKANQENTSKYYTMGEEANKFYFNLLELHPDIIVNDPKNEFVKEMKNGGNK